MTFVIECILRVSAILAAAFLITAALRRQSAALRHLLWTIAFALSALTPLLFPWGPGIGRAPAQITVISIAATAAIPRVETAPRHARTIPYDRVAVLVWGMGVLALAARAGRAMAAARALQRSAGPLTPFQGVPVSECGDAAVAMTAGVWKPVILLPPEHRTWTAAQLQSVLLHELAHVRRRDCLTQWLPQAICALHWFNPLAWLARSQMLCESERACDDAVLRAGASGPDFARDLFEIAQFTGLKGAELMPTFVTKLERRIARLLDPSIQRAPLSRMKAIASAVAVLALLLPIAGIRAQSTTGTGAISGLVFDPTGAVIANAVVHLSGPSGKLAVAANPAGVWIAQGLPPGTYQVEVAVPGFETYRQVNVEVAPGASIQLKEPLAIGQVAESMTVTAPAPAPRATAPAAPTKPIRVGGMVQAAKLISRTPPVYPDSLRQQGIEGTVLVQAIIGKTGSVLNAQAVGAQAPPELADAALAAVRTWQFEPTLLNGEPVEIITTVTVNFQLR